MANSYALTDNVEDTFPFEIRDKKYVMRYPITEEVEEVKALSNKITEAQEKDDKDEVAKLNDKLENFIYSFISPEGHDTPVKDALAKENIRVMRNFNTMIKAELSLQ
jgi:hypothetical protein